MPEGILEGNEENEVIEAILEFGGAEDFIDNDPGLALNVIYGKSSIERVPFGSNPLHSKIQGTGSYDNGLIITENSKLKLQLTNLQREYEQLKISHKDLHLRNEILSRKMTDLLHGE